MSIERTGAALENYNQILSAYMDRKGWNVEEQREMFRYLGHSLVSAQGAYEVMSFQDEVHERIDRDLAEQGGLWCDQGTYLDRE